MGDFDGGASSYSGLPPHRVRGVTTNRVLPVLPEPSIVEPEIPSNEAQKFSRWFATWGGTFPEYLAFDWLERKGLAQGEDFIFQSSRMGGRQLYGGAVVDFDFPDRQLAWRIQGEHFHIGNPAKEASDIMQKMSLETLGYTVIDVYAQDVLERRNYVLTHALNGEQTRSLREGGW